MKLILSANNLFDALIKWPKWYSLPDDVDVVIVVVEVVVVDVVVVVLVVVVVEVVNVVVVVVVVVVDVVVVVLIRFSIEKHIFKAIDLFIANWYLFVSLWNTR